MLHRYKVFAKDMHIPNNNYTCSWTKRRNVKIVQKRETALYSRQQFHQHIEERCFCCLAAQSKQRAQNVSHETISNTQFMPINGKKSVWHVLNGRMGTKAGYSYIRNMTHMCVRQRIKYEIEREQNRKDTNLSAHTHTHTQASRKRRCIALAEWAYQLNAIEATIRCARFALHVWDYTHAHTQWWIHSNLEWNWRRCAARLCCWVMKCLFGVCQTQGKCINIHICALCPLQTMCIAYRVTLTPIATKYEWRQIDRQRWIEEPKLWESNANTAGIGCMTYPRGIEFVETELTNIIEVWIIGNLI